MAAAAAEGQGAAEGAEAEAGGGEAEAVEIFPASEPEAAAEGGQLLRSLEAEGGKGDEGGGEGGEGEGEGEGEGVGKAGAEAGAEAAAEGDGEGGGEGGAAIGAKATATLKTLRTKGAPMVILPFTLPLPLQPNPTPTPNPNPNPRRAQGPATLHPRLAARLAAAPPRGRYHLGATLAYLPCLSPVSPPHLPRISLPGAGLRQRAHRQDTRRQGAPAQARYREP